IMPIWDKTTNQPKHLNRAEKRNVIATDVGWVRRKVKTDVEGNVRVQDEVLVAISGLANSTNMGAPDIIDIWHSTTEITANTEYVDTYVAFNEPVRSTTALKIAVANTAGGAAVNAISNSTIYFAN